MRTPWIHPVTGRSGRARRSPRRPAAESLEGRRMLDGLTGEYFKRIDHTELATTRLDPTIDFSWGGAPASGVGIGVDKFSVRWTGQVQAQFNETYTFTTTADDGVRLWVNGRLLVDNFVNQGSTDRTGSVALEAGKRYDIRLDYYEYDLNARIRLQWSSSSTAKQTVPASQLFPSPSGLSGTYYDDLNFARPVLERTDVTVDFDWPSGTPDTASVAADGFSARWTGYIVPAYSETYSFRATTPPGSGSTIQRLRIDGKLVLDNASVQDDGRIALEAGKRYPITLDYTDPISAAGVKLEWSSPSQPLQTVPSDRLFAGAATSIPTRRTTYTNPTLDIDAPDPSIIFADNAYWMIHTMGGPSTGWPLWKSLDGVTWTFQKHLLTTANKQSWMNGNYWAPEIHKVGSNFILTGTSIDSRSGRMVIAMASSPTIDGTYTIRSEPLQADTVHVIDSNIFVDDDGKAYLLWKRDSNTTAGQHGTIRIRQLDSTGLSFAPGSTETVILDNETGGWERSLAEAPWLVRRADAYYLFYSGGFIDTTYSIGVARNTNLTSMFTRNPVNPIISNNATWGGPGHGGFAMDADGTLWHLYHARKMSNPNFGRVQVLDPVVWTGTGWPSFAGNSVSATAQLGPRVAALTGAGNLTLSGDAGGTASNDVFRLVRSGAGNAMLDLYVNGTLTRSIPFAEVQMITIDAKDGDDTLQLDFTNGDVVAGAGLSFIGGAGTLDTVRITAPDGTLDAFRHLGNGAFAIGAGLFSSSGTEKLSLNGGEHRVVADLTNATTLELSAGHVTFVVNQKLGGLSILSGASATLSTGGRSLLTTALQIFGSGRLDITDGALVVDYAAGEASPIATVESLLRTGRGDGSWNGTSGIISSVAATNRAVGAIGSGEMTDLYTGTFAAFAGLVVDRSSVLVRYTLDGDTNLNRTTDFTDLLALAKNYGQSGKSFTGGNVDYSSDGLVSFDDLLLLAKQYGQTLTVSAAVFAQASTTRTRKSTASDLLA